METNFTLTRKYIRITIALMVVGVISLILGFIVDVDRTWPIFLLNNYYFLSLTIGATFFIAIQNITQSGWAVLFKRIPEAIGAYIPVSGILMLGLILGVTSIYDWTEHHAAVESVAEAKYAFLNIPFFIVRIFFYFIIWIGMIYLLRRESLREDLEGGLDHFRRSEFYSKIYIFLLAVTFSMATFDWIMSIDEHWFSTIFALKNFVAAFYHGTAMIALIVILLNENGYLKLLNKSHLHDFSRYIFMLGILWIYFWFSQYLLIWYANIPEETIYYVTRMEGNWIILFIANIVINWFIPFIVLLSTKADRSKKTLKIICILLIIGQWIDLYLQIVPNSSEVLNIGFIEIGTFIGFIGLFAFVIGKSLSMASLIPKNHPYLEESMYHDF